MTSNRDTENAAPVVAAEDETVTIIAETLAVLDGYDPADNHGGLYDLRWSSGSMPEPLGDAWSMDYLPKAERIFKELSRHLKHTRAPAAEGATDDLMVYAEKHSQYVEEWTLSMEQLRALFKGKMLTPAWVCTSERKPPANFDVDDGHKIAHVLVASDDGAMASAMYDPDSGRWGIHGMDFDEPPFWCEFPPLPVAALTPTPGADNDK